MDQKNFLTYDVPKKVFNDVEKYCVLNKIDNINDFMFKCFKQGFDIEKYGLLGDDGQLKPIEKEVIKEVEKIVEVTKEVPVEKVIEVVKEVEKIVEIIKEVPVEKIVKVSDDTKQNELLLKIQQLEEDLKTKSELQNEDKIKLLQETLQKIKKQNIDLQKEIENLKDKLNQVNSFDNQGKVVYHRGSNINNNLLK